MLKTFFYSVFPQGWIPRSYFPQTVWCDTLVGHSGIKDAAHREIILFQELWELSILQKYKESRLRLPHSELRPYQVCNLVWKDWQPLILKKPVLWIWDCSYISALTLFNTFLLFWKDKKCRTLYCQIEHFQRLDYLEKKCWNVEMWKTD